MSVNKVILVGNVGKDPDMRYTADGRPIANLSVATSESWNDKRTGEKREKTEWHRVVAFGKLAEICDKYITKGMQVYVEGKLQTRSWDDQSGIKKYSTEIVVDIQGKIQFFGGKKQEKSIPAYENTVPDIGQEDDIPF